MALPPRRRCLHRHFSALLGHQQRRRPLHSRRPPARDPLQKPPAQERPRRRLLQRPPPPLPRNARARRPTAAAGRQIRRPLT